jgi:Phosphofructokinase
MWAASSVGRAPRSQCGGRGFEPRAVHQPSLNLSSVFVASIASGHRVQIHRLYSNPAAPDEAYRRPTLKKIGVLTGGGDAPGLNAVIRAVVKASTNAGIQVVGLEDSFDGLIYPEKSRILTPHDVTGILRLGGTMLGTVNRGDPFAEPIVTPQGTFDYGDRVV